MKVIVPYVAGMLNHRVLPAIERQHYEPVMWEIDPGNPHDYRDRIGTWFSAIEILGDLAIVEHDVESRTGALASFEECPEPYCFHAYRFNVPFDDAMGPAELLAYAPLGHTRFRASIAAELAAVIESPSWTKAPGYGDLDGIIGSELKHHGILPHRHIGDVIHHHDYTER